jgi:hypothetical protein
MKHSLVIRAATLLFCTAGLTLAVLHGCSKTPPPASSQAAPAAPGSSATVAEEQQQEEENPAYLGATKAAVMVHPKPSNSANSKKK